MKFETILNEGQLGTKKAKVFETAVAMITPFYIEKRFSNAIKCIEYIKKTSNDVLIKELNSLFQRFFGTGSPALILESLLSNEKWLVGTCYTAEAIKKELKATKKDTFHKDSDVVKQLEAHVKKLLKDANVSGMDINKWNPADVWMFKNPTKTLRTILKFKTIEDINEYMMREAKGGRNIVGISLKKATKNPPVKWFNIAEMSKEADVELDQIKHNIMTKLTAMTKDALLIDLDDNIKFQIRSTRKIGTRVKGEIKQKGKKGLAGGVGFTAMVGWLEKNTKGKVIQFSRNEIIIDEQISEKFLGFFLHIILELKKRKELDVGFLRNFKDMKDLEKVIEELTIEKKGDINQVGDILSSKVQALQIALHANDDFFKFVYKYSTSSIGNTSSVFLKIGA